MVLDGQQRLKTLDAYHKGRHAGKEFALQNVADEFKGLTYETLSPEQRRTLDTHIEIGPRLPNGAMVLIACSGG